MTEEEMLSAFDMMGFRKLEKADADFWQIRFESLEEAVAARDAIASGDTPPEAYESYARMIGQDARRLDELGTYVRRAPLDAPVVIGTGDGAWYVVEVQRRDIRFTSFEDAREEIAEKVSPYMPEMRLLKELRKTAAVEVDAELFEEMMELGA
jgi:hypothetical protein